VTNWSRLGKDDHVIRMEIVPSEHADAGAGMDELVGAVNPHELAGAMLRSMRAYAGLSQRELAAKAGVSVSTVSRAEGRGGAPPSWDSMVRLARACGCSVWFGIPDSATVATSWPFEAARDSGGRHLPAHLAVWRLGRAREWSSFHKYSCFADPPFPPYSYTMRPRRRVPPAQ
jgi:transcriptional regulator with XRE-family HTH domain